MNFFSVRNVRESKALTKEKLRKWGRLSGKGYNIKFVDVRFKR